MAHIASVAKSTPVSKLAKPLLSVTSNEARRRVLNLYRAWWREVFNILLLSNLLLKKYTFL